MAEAPHASPEERGEITLENTRRRIRQTAVIFEAYDHMESVRVEWSEQGEPLGRIDVADDFIHGL